MVFLMYLRHQPGYVACYTRSSLEHLAQYSRGTVELFSNVLLNFGGRRGMQAVWTAVRPSSGTGDGTPVRKCLQLSVG